eukprot:TRINITY_DN4252_c0_g1_i1.p3 TRINITY_DN4252_c0_g1~~TRINITY_DN4252_c0_g1_i1.p3  ORF type:complete len:117 (+),score=30.89 TRINITY_DN4252_c0_g1_i1:849-1199(+)
MGNYVASAPGSPAPVTTTVNQTIHFGRVDHTAPGATNAHYPVACTQAGTHWLVLPTASFYSVLPVTGLGGWRAQHPLPQPPPGAPQTIAIDMFTVKDALYEQVYSDAQGVGAAAMP